MSEWLNRGSICCSHSRLHGAFHLPVSWLAHVIVLFRSGSEFGHYCEIQDNDNMEQFAEVTCMPICRAYLCFLPLLSLMRSLERHFLSLSVTSVYCTLYAFAT